MTETCHTTCYHPNGGSRPKYVSMGRKHIVPGKCICATVTVRHSFCELLAARNMEVNPVGTTQEANYG